MKGDYTRLTFDPARGYTRVLLQQGRVELDADSSEEEAIDEHLRKLESIRRILESQEAGTDKDLVEAANVVRATHGETHVEVLGSGDRAESVVTLGEPAVRWEFDKGEVVRARVLDDSPEALESAGLSDFTVTSEPDGSASICFGDGQPGARVPTGVVLISTTYRVGPGEAGNVGAGDLTTIVGRPLGVSSVTNPLPAGGGADPSRIPCWMVGIAVGAVAAAVSNRVTDRSGESSDTAVSIVERLADVADRLSAYQDAIANEGYLDTARERLSLRRHSRLIGYRPRRGRHRRVRRRR